MSSIAIPVVAAGAEASMCTLNGCVDHNWFENVTNRMCYFYDGDTHEVGEFYERTCMSCGVYETGYRTYMEGHFYDYNYDIGFWVCECGDRYTHN